MPLNFRRFASYLAPMILKVGALILATTVRISESTSIGTLSRVCAHGSSRPGAPNGDLHLRSEVKGFITATSEQPVSETWNFAEHGRRHLTSRLLPLPVLCSTAYRFCCRFVKSEHLVETLSWRLALLVDAAFSMYSADFKHGTDDADGSRNPRHRFDTLIRAEDRLQRSVLFHAYEYPDEPLQHLLDPDLRSSSGCGDVYKAYQIEIAELLLEFGADPHFKGWRCLPSGRPDALSAGKYLVSDFLQYNEGYSFTACFSGRGLALSKRLPKDMGFVAARDPLVVDYSEVSPCISELHNFPQIDFCPNY